MIRTQTRAWLAPAAVAVALFAPRVVHAQRQVTVNVDSLPQGATVRVDSETNIPIGNTPLRRVRVPVGSHTLYFTREGFLPGRLDVQIQRRNETFAATLTQGGSVYVSADVDGAQVFLDGNAVGTTPGRINNVPPGQHVIEIRQQGVSPFRDTVTVGAGAVASVNASLRPPTPAAQPTGTVRVIVTNPNGPTPADLQVKLDGTTLQGDPPANDSIIPGQHIIHVSASGFRTERREVTVSAGQAVTLAVDLAPNAPTGGTVRVIVPTPGAQVFLDGEQVGGTPPVRENVPAGQHTLRITATGRQQIIREITVTAGQPVVIEIPDLPQVPQVGRMTVRSSTPNVRISVDGRPVGPPFSRDDMPAGAYEVLVEAPGFDSRSQRCTVSPTQSCELDMTLTQTVGRTTLRVELAQPLRNNVSAQVLIDGNPMGEVGGGRDIPDVPARTHEIRVRALGYADYVENVTLEPNILHRTVAVMHRLRTGLTRDELALRRGAISTWGGQPLWRGDVALDALLGYGAYPLEVRGTTGIGNISFLGFDTGFSIRTMFYYWELEVRGRAGIRLADGVFGLAVDARPFVGLGGTGQGNYGFSGFLVASLHTLVSADEDSDEDPNARVNRPGTFAFSLHLGFEAVHDGLNGMVWSRAGWPFDRSGIAFNPALCNGGTCIVNQPRGDQPGTVVQGAQDMVRPLVGMAIEVGLGRHQNLFVSVDRVLGDKIDFRRALYQSFWGGSDSMTYIRTGLTFKF